MAPILRTYGAWTIVNEDVVNRHCDFSCHEHKVTKIIKEIRQFWGVPNLPKGKYGYVWLTFNGKRQKVKIELETNGQRRLRFSPEMRAYMKDKPYGKYIVDLTFTKIKDKEYMVDASCRKVDLNIPQDEPLQSVIEHDNLKEGKKKGIYTTIYERIPKYRDEAIQIHKCKCMVCGFDFKKKYGKRGEGFIEVHHVNPLSSLTEPVTINPNTDLVCVCSNCHRMIHHKKDDVLTVEQLKDKIKEAKLEGEENENT